MFNNLKTEKTMKQTYFAPSTAVVNINTASVLMLSLSVDNSGSTTVGGGDPTHDPGQLTRGGWSSENWSEIEDEE